MRFIFLASMLLVSSFVYAQSTADIGRIAFSIEASELQQGLDQAQQSQLESKIKQIITKNGFASNSFQNNFVIYPQLSGNKVDQVEGGMQTITVFTADLALFIKQTHNNIVFSSINIPIKGSGSNEKSAITNAISRINTGDKNVQNLLVEAKNKIVTTYEQNCSKILSKADNMAAKREYEAALSLLMSVPAEVSCYANVEAKSVTIFAAHQNNVCEKLIREAKAKQMRKEYGEAIELLSQVDPASNCTKEADALVAAIEDKMEKDQKIAAMRQIREDNVKLQRQRIEAIKQIAVAYYTSHPTIRFASE